jgi:uncharacterized protein involved in type VI secretion and phage assembly
MTGERAMDQRPAWTAAIHLGRVTDGADPEGRGRVRVMLAGLKLELWAAVLIPGGGAGYGVALGLREGETVAVSFAGGDPAAPIVLGALWSGPRSKPPAAPEPGYAVVSPEGARLAIDDAGGPTVTVETGKGGRLVIEGDAGLVVECAGNAVRMGPTELAVESDATVTIRASKVKIEAAAVEIAAPLVTVPGLLKAETVQAVTMIAAAYTPGAGNIW